MKFTDKPCNEFINEIAANTPIPGSGGATALVGAAGAALAMMVGSLTIDSERYADVEPEIVRLIEEAEKIKTDMMRLVDDDAKAFMPLARAYGMPKDDPSRVQIMEDALRRASSVPMDVMRLSAAAIDLCKEYSVIGARVALSNVGIGAVCCKAALQGAALNVFINTKYMDSRGHAKKLETEANDLLRKYCPLADEIYNSVASKLL